MHGHVVAQKEARGFDGDLKGVVKLVQLGIGKRGVSVHSVPVIDVQYITTSRRVPSASNFQK